MKKPASHLVEGPALAGAVPAMTVPRFIRECSRRHAAAVAMVDAATGRQVTYETLALRIGRYAAGLAAHGFRAGDTLLMFSPNSPEWEIAHSGRWPLAAAPAVPVLPPPRQSWHQMHDAKARFIYMVPALLGTARQEAASTECDAVIIVPGEAPGAAAPRSARAGRDASARHGQGRSGMTALPSAPVSLEKQVPLLRNSGTAALSAGAAFS